jgi:hypothetical protein
MTTLCPPSQDPQPTASGRSATEAPNRPDVIDESKANHVQVPRSTSPFRKAVKRGAKLRFAVCGPSGSGKTYTLLKVATELGGPIAVVDTERGSASKYADLFEFDVMELGSYNPLNLIEIIDAAASTGHQVLCIDSLSHFWMGKDGELEQVDRAARRMQAPNSFAAWKQITPIHNQLVDKIISAPMHVLVGLRSKTEWVLERDDKTGKTTPRKVGLAPVMRDGIEYEFDVCGEMDQENTLVITKSRCPKLTSAVFSKPGRDIAELLKEWLSETPKPPANQNISSMTTSRQPHEAHETTRRLNASTGTNGSIPPELAAVWKRMCSPRGVAAALATLKEQLIHVAGAEAELLYQAILKRHDVEHASQLKSRQLARLCAKELFLEIERFDGLHVGTVSIDVPRQTSGTDQSN